MSVATQQSLKAAGDSKTSENRGVSVPADSGKESIRGYLSRPEIRVGIKEALAGWMDEGSFIQSLLISFQDPTIVDCSPQSLFKAAHDCASLALQPVLDQVALIPRNNTVNGRKVKECTVMPQWQGYHALMMRFPEVEDIKAKLVHKNDKYWFDAKNEQIEDHEYDPFDPERVFAVPDDVRGGYLVIEWRDRTRPKKFHFVTADTIKKARACAQADNIWRNWFMEQCLKTVYRNAYARRAVPIDPLVSQRIARANAFEDAVLGNDPSRVIETTAIASYPRTVAGLEQMVNQSGSKTGSTEAGVEQHQDESVNGSSRETVQVMRQPGEEG